MKSLVSSFNGALSFTLSVFSVIAILLAPSLATANNNEARSLVAPYVHVPASLPGIAGPYSTEYYVAATTGNTSTTVNVKCYNEYQDRIGPAGGSLIELNDGATAFDTDIVNPVNLQLTTDPDFTTRGWCWFERLTGDDFSVGVAMGLGNGQGAILTNNASRAVSMSSASGNVSNQDGSVPIWARTGGGFASKGGWESYLIAINPTTIDFTMTVDVYDTGGNVLGSNPFDGPSASPLLARDLDVYELGTAGGGSATRGNADVSIPYVNTRGFAAWVLGVNYVSLESFLYAVPMDKDDTMLLSTLGFAP